MDHAHFMQIALNHADSMAGQTWPNPTVGAVLVKNGQIIAKAVTAKGGRPHAEAQIIEQASDNAKGATLYVTLEPCANHGDTPPCVEAIINAGIQQVVIASPDKDVRTYGKSVEQLRGAGVNVVEDVLREQAEWQHRGFFSRMEKDRPWVTLKMASSLDGKVALGNGNSKWITGEQARAYGHMLRAEHDAILSTSRSVANDNALLTCRLPGLEHRSPLRIVIDRNLQLKPDGNIFSTDISPIWIISYKDGDDGFVLPGNTELCTLHSSKTWLEDLFGFLGKRGINRVLVECGGTFASALLGADLVDELQWFTAPIIIGEDGISSIRSLNLDTLDGLRHWRRHTSRMLGDDRLDVLIKARS